MLFSRAKPEQSSERTVLNRRLLIVGVLTAIAVVSYVALHRYSPVLVGYVVEQTLLQKAPDGADLTEIRSSFEAWIEGFPGGDARLKRLFAVSQQLEKVQKLSDLELKHLLEKETGPRPIR